jgi:3-methyladenine DNA glycosylase AlkD
VEKLLTSKIHEERFCALEILVFQAEKASEVDKKKLFDFYLAHTANINNWDLVDTSCRQIVGDFLLDKDRKILRKLAKSTDLWERRIAMISTNAFIRNNQFEDTYEIAEILLHDTHDLIHKAVGWMLREAGNRDRKSEEAFLKKHYKTMPGTMLRYAIEKFPQDLRKAYMTGTV